MVLFCPPTHSISFFSLSPSFPSFSPSPSSFLSHSSLVVYQLAFVVQRVDAYCEGTVLLVLLLHKYLTYLTHCRQFLLHAKCIRLMLWGKPRHTHISPLDRHWKYFPSLPCVTRCGLCEKTASIAPVAAQG